MTRWAARKLKRANTRRVRALEVRLNASDEKATGRISFTAEQDRFIREQYRRLTLKDLAVAFRATFGPVKTTSQIRSYINRNGIKSGRTGCFEVGMKPWNTGKKGYMGPNATSFKKGNLPHNHKRLWSERLSKDGYIEISVPERNPHTGFPQRYKFKHVWLWECANGPRPEGTAVVFRDGNNRNFDLENLLLVSRAELLSMNLHGYKNMPGELKPSVLALAKVEARAGFRTRPGRGRQKI